MSHQPGGEDVSTAGGRGVVKREGGGGSIVETFAFILLPHCVCLLSTNTVHISHIVFPTHLHTCTHTHTHSGFFYLLTRLIQYAQMRVVPL